MKFIVVGYYTRGTFYEGLASEFEESLKKYAISYYIEAIDSLGDWHLNTSYKPTFLKQMLRKFPDKDIVYVDVDAKFFAYPILFESLQCNIAVHLFDRRLHRTKATGFEVLSGTVFLKNNEEVRGLVDKWEALCIAKPYVWDQKSLEKVLGEDFYNLPPEYCIIFDVMKHIKDPVIVHYQASRKVRKNKRLLKKKVV